MVTNSFNKLTHQSQWDNVGVEFKKKYGNSFLLLNKTQIVQVKDMCFTKNQKTSFITVKNIDGDFQTINCVGEDSLEVVWPENGFFTYNGALYVASRLDERQYTWGPVSSNLMILDFLHYIYGVSKNTLDRDTFQAALFNPSPILSLELLSTPIVGFSLTKNLGVTIHPTTENLHTIWYNSLPIAIIEGNKIVIEEKWFAQEILDYLRDYNVKEFILG